MLTNGDLPERPGPLRCKKKWLRKSPGLHEAWTCFKSRLLKFEHALSLAFAHRRLESSDCIVYHNISAGEKLQSLALTEGSAVFSRCIV
ncbi:hypothetical protein MPTK1_5g11800 [Marchantia polymorpha subsp. ruderalis]|uniref:Uncharacterized protein n=2 Tax=Marchantia polymorpha TaxID=3197 RepID=A0AAF6BHE4_MARPO|nr:hypothetical protein MARPO_0143s0008 [Marchantia polymorpha]BBN11428.1 hypothetical protein Mp_5g11800 [Marchantia polymorpha subsp. ruderalis]|eukprot:PTQ29326.1 hypothetical protein MARPO_0143s0008 [Marchantia polymorpha]